MHYDQDHAEYQALAVTLALLLLIGGVLLIACWSGVWVAFAAGAGSVVAAYAAPRLIRRIAARRAVRRLLRSLPG
ncbi:MULTISPECIES: hypothetical protein [Streptomyces]|uniref:hypothetical protein n=1 Tax=Streptomyces TaxID=1883 RepID=UPI00136956B9|nr:hypothetical protein [Streptomyces sp. SID2888]MYV47988.1 hypothetical protein [Streptomyces sp. SID2888]